MCAYMYACQCVRMSMYIDSGQRLTLTLQIYASSGHNDGCKNYDNCRSYYAHMFVFMYCYDVCIYGSI